jgi:hypothetical protein
MINVSHYNENGISDVWNSQEIKKGKILYYKEELKNQLDYKKNLLKGNSLKLNEYITPADLICNDLHALENERTQRNGINENSKNSKLNQSDENSNNAMYSASDRKSKVQEDRLKEEIETHLKKNKQQKQYFDSLSKQIEDKNKMNVDMKSSVGSKRTKGSIELEEEVKIHK